MTSSFRRIVWPLALAQTILWATTYYSFPALLLEWERNLGWSKAQLSGALTLALVVSAILAPVAGRFIDRGFGGLVLTGGAVLGALSLLLLSRVTWLWQFYAVWIMMGAAMAGGLYEACFAVLTRVMGSRAKQAITLVTLAAGFAGTLAFPGIHVLAGMMGWRGAVRVLAVIIILVAVPLTRSGCLAAEGLEKKETIHPGRRSADAFRILRKATFWLLAVVFAATILEHGILLTHLLPLLDERGIHSQAAVLAASMIGPMQVTGRLAVMAAGGRISSFGILAACFIAMGIAAALLLGSGTVPALLVGFVMFQGAGFGVTSIMRPVVTAEFLGRTDFGLISGLLAVPFLCAMAAAPTVAAFVWEAGGYDLVIRAAICISMIGLIALSAAARSSKRSGP